MTNILVIGDIHIGKKFNTYKPNIYSNHQYTSLTQLWTPLTIGYIKNTITQNSGNVDCIVFLGDIFDKPSLRPEDINLFTEILNHIQSLNIEAHIVVGNHDTTEPLNPNGTLLNLYSGRKNVYVYHEPVYVESLNSLMFPYMKREQLSDELSKWSNTISSQPMIFSHNDFYVNDTFIMTEMLNVEILKDMFGVETKIFNGHIHNFYYEPSAGIFFTGSVSPTSFKDSPMASGICYVEYNETTNTISKFKSYRNNKIVFITIDNENYIAELEKYLVKYREYGIKVVLRYSHSIRKQMEKVLTLYSDVIFFYKDYIHADEVQSDSSISSEQSPDISTIKKKVEMLVDKGYSKEEIIGLFVSFISKKYGYDESDIRELTLKE